MIFMESIIELLQVHTSNLHVCVLKQKKCVHFVCATPSVILSVKFPPIHNELNACFSVASFVSVVWSMERP